MPPKKKKANPITGYAIFVQEQRKLHEARGHHFPKKNDEAFLFVGNLWKKLSDEEKKRYNDMAKDQKRQGASDLESKFNSLGVSYAEIEKEKQEKEEFNNIMRNTIVNAVKETNIRDTLKSKKFYLIHVNYFYVNSSGNFKPAEIALSEFNLKRGVLSTFHEFINPGPIEYGFRFEAKRRMDETHKIPFEDSSWKAEKDYVHLLHQIKQFLTKDFPNGRIPPIYTMPNDEKNNYSISAVRNTIETLCEAADEDPAQFRIYELPLLYLELRKKVMAESPCNPDPTSAEIQTLSLALHDLERDKFMYTKGIGCKYHEEKDVVNFCSKSAVTRLVYSMCDFLLNYLPEDIFEGGHAPRACLKVSEIRGYDDDGFETIPLRRPQIKPQIAHESSVSSKNTNVIRPPTFATSLVAPRPLASSVLAQSQNQRTVSNGSISSAQLRFQPPIRRPPGLSQDSKDDDDTPRSIYEDAASSLPSPNMSQNTVMSGYTASASLTQSSYASGLSQNAFPILGRGRGLPRQPLPPVNMNWALGLGRGSKLKPQQQ